MLPLTRGDQMHGVESRRADLRGGFFTWILPVVIAVCILALSWTGLFVVVSDLIDAASRLNATDSVHE